MTTPRRNPANPGNIKLSAPQFTNFFTDAAADNQKAYDARRAQKLSDRAAIYAGTPGFSAAAAQTMQGYGLDLGILGNLGHLNFNALTAEPAKAAAPSPIPPAPSPQPPAPSPIPPAPSPQPAAPAMPAAPVAAAADPAAVHAVAQQLMAVLGQVAGKLNAEGVDPKSHPQFSAIIAAATAAQEAGDVNKLNACLQAAKSLLG